MKLWRRNMIFVLLQVLAVVCAIVCADAQTNDAVLAVSGTVDGLRLPLGYHDNGQLKSQLKAEKATVSEDGPIYATNITSEFFTVEGDLDVVMTAEDCRYDKIAKFAKSDHNVRVEKKGIVITGTGFEWDANEQAVKVMSNVVVVISRAMLGAGVPNMMKGKKR